MTSGTAIIAGYDIRTNLRDVSDKHIKEVIVSIKPLKVARMYATSHIVHTQTV